MTKSLQRQTLAIDAASLRAFFQSQRAPVARASLTASIAVYVWVILLTSADIKSITTPYIHWWTLLPLGTLLFPTLVRAHWRLDLSALFAGVFFTAAVLISGWEDPKYAAEQAGKLGAICLGSVILFQQFPALTRVAFTALQHAVILNTLCLATIFFFPGLAAEQMAPGRWGTVMNAPGSLWRVGIVTLVYGAYLLYVERPFPIRGFVLFACSATLIYADGSRTAMFLIPLSVVYLGFVLLRETKTHADTLRLACLVIIGVFAAGLFLDARSRMFGTYSDNADALTRFTQFSDQLSSDGLVNSDPVRYEMVRSTLDRIKEQPFFGRGIGQTRVNTDAGPMVVHMTYLQLWADLGIFGLLAYLWVICGWTPRLRRALVAIGRYGSARDRALYYNAVFVLMFFVFSGFFHPVSTEWSEWIAFAVALGFFTQVVSAIPSAGKRVFAVVRASGPIPASVYDRSR